MKSPWVSDCVIWVAMECSHHNPPIFPRMFVSGTAVGQGTGWDLSHDSVEDATYEIVFPVVQNLTSVGKAQWSTTSEKILYRYAELPQRVKFFLDKIVLSEEATFYLSGKVNHHNLIIWGSQNPLQVDEVHRKMDRSWLLHSMATQITQSHTHGLLILGIRKR
jgi:hypothetical protein